MGNQPGRHAASARRRIAGWAAAALGLALALVLARAPLLRFAGGQLVHEDALGRSDAILVLAGDAPAREMAAADLFAAGWAPVILLTIEPPRPALEALRSRGVRVETEVEERVRYLVELGVPAEAIVVLPGAVESTWAEAERAVRWAREVGAERLIVVTSRFHTARARFVLRRALNPAGVTIRMRGAHPAEFVVEDWWRNRTMLRNGLFEWQKLVFYRIRYCCS